MRALWADLWRRRWFRWTFTPVASIALSWCCICLILNYVGERRWQQVKARLEADGESFDYFALLPPPIPDEQNFCAIEALNGIRAAEGPGEIAILGKKKRDEINRQSAFLEPKDRMLVSINPLYEAVPPDDRVILSGLGRKGVSLLGKELPPKTWQEVRTELEKNAPVLIELCQAVRQRPHAEHLPRPAPHELPRPLMRMSFEQLTVCQPLSDLVRLYALACLRCDDVRTSLDASLVLLRIAQADDSNRSLLGNLVAATHQTQFHSLLWLYLEGRHLDDASLLLVQQELQRFDPTKQHLASLRSELALGVDTYDYLQAHPVERWNMLGSASDLVSSASIAKPVALLSVVMPGGFFSLSKASDIELMCDGIIKPLKNQGLRHFETEITRVHALLQASTAWKRPDLLLAKMSVPTFALIHRMMILHENQHRQALLACALERHYLRHAGYPAVLEALDAEFLAGLSLLDVNGEKMHYQQTSGGRYRLWSIGPDGVDNGGKFGSEVVNGARGRTPSHPQYLGDWVWRYDQAVEKP